MFVLIQFRLMSTKVNKSLTIYFMFIYKIESN